MVQAGALAQAIIETGRINKTIYLLNYVDCEDYRRRILTQLNRGEGRDALPLYRLEQQTKRRGYAISRDKLSRWINTLDQELVPFVKVLEDFYNSHHVGGVDETRLQVLREAERLPSQNSCLFIRYGGPPNKRVMLVNYREDKKQNTIKELLEDFSGSLVCDMYQGFINIGTERKDVRVYACHDHS